MKIVTLYYATWSELCLCLSFSEQRVETAGNSDEWVSYRPGGRLCCTRLLEGHIKGVRPRIICVGRDGRRGRKGIKGGAGLGVGWRGRHVVLCVVVVVGAGRGGAAVLNVLIHAVQQPQVCVLRLRQNGGDGRKDRRKYLVIISESKRTFNLTERMQTIILTTQKAKILCETWKRQNNCRKLDEIENQRKPSGIGFQEMLL